MPAISVAHTVKGKIQRNGECTWLRPGSLNTTI